MFKIRTLLPCCRVLANSTKTTATKLYTNQWQSMSLHSNVQILRTIAPQPQYRHYASATNDESKKLGDFSGQERVYYGSLTPRMRAVKIFSLTTSLTGLAAQPVLMEQGMKIGGTGMAVLFCSVAGFFTFVTPFLLHFITKKYVTEIHYDPRTEEYTATTISIILQKLHTKFKPSDVKVPEVPGMFTSCVVKNKPLFIDPALFENPEHYVRIMGYDKPIDFKLDLKPDESTKTETENKKMH